MIEFTKEELENEIWKKLDECHYGSMISNLGRLKRVKRNGEIFITLGSNSVQGYKRAYLTNEAGGKTYKIHRLVAKYFLDDFYDYETVNHMDFNKENNKVSNLEMMTPEENTLHYINSKKRGVMIGVHFHTRLKKWVVRHKRRPLGTFINLEDAESALKFYLDNGYRRPEEVKYSDDLIYVSCLLFSKVKAKDIAKEFSIPTNQVIKCQRKHRKDDLSKLVISDSAKSIFKKLSRKPKTGQVYTSVRFGKFEILKRYGVKCDIKFEDGTIIENLNYDAARRGKVRNPNFKYLKGIGFLGVGEYTTHIHRKAGDCWRRIINSVSKKEVKICEDWENFQNFAKWYFSNRPKDENSYILDFKSEEKNYNPENSIFITKGEFIKKYKTLKQYATNI